MKKLFMCVLVLCLFTSITYSNSDRTPQQQTAPAPKQTSKAVNTAKENNLQKQGVAKPIQGNKNVAIKYPVFDTYRIGEKFENKGYEGKELRQITPFLYEASLEPEGKMIVRIYITGKGIISGIKKQYKLNTDFSDFFKIFVRKLNMSFDVKQNLTTYKGENKKTKLLISKDYYVTDDLKMVDIANVELSDKALTKQMLADVENRAKKLEKEKIEKEAVNFKI